VEFTYQELQYVLPGGETVPLATVLETLGLSGNVQSVTVSNTELFEAKNEVDGWTVYSYQPFQTEEWMKVTLDWIEYTIKVTDASEVTVTFDMHGHGTKVPSQTFEAGGKAIEPDNPGEKDDYIFYKWYGDSEYTTLFSFNTAINKDTTVHARSRCRIKFSTEHGTKPNNQLVLQNAKADKDRAGCPTEEGYVFIEWCSDEACTTAFDFDTPITEPRTLFAKHNPAVAIVEDESGRTEDGRYALALNLDYATYKDSVEVYVDDEKLIETTDYTISSGSTIVTLTKDYISSLADGRYLLRVDTSAGSAERYFNVASGSIPNTYTVSFVNKVAGVTNWPIDQPVPVNEKATRPIPDPTASNYHFDDWYADLSLTELFDFANTAITKDTAVYAKWNCEVRFYTVHGTAPTTQIVNIDGTATKPADLSWIGYKWGGWIDEAGISFDFKKPITKNTNLYANWIPDLKITKGNGGTAHYGSTYEFTLNYYYPDYVANKDLFDVYVAKSGSSYALLSKDHYAVTQDTDKRVKVTLRSTYIRTLTDGATYYILFDTGLPDPPTDLGDTEGNFKVSKAPKTGDESNVGLWITIAAVSAVAVIAIIAYLLHKRKKSKLPPTPPEKAPENEKKTKKPPKE